jgi:hypothetical protein
MTSETENIAAEKQRLKVSPYDRASSWLISLLISVGLLAAMLVTLWLSSLSSKPPRGDQGKVWRVDSLTDGEDGQNGKPVGGGNLDSMPDTPLPRPDPTASNEISEMEEVLSDGSVTDQLPELEKLSRPPSDAGIPGLPGPPGTGLDKRPGKPGKPRNWEIVFPKGTVEQYAKQLDFFKIELGVIKKNTIVYASNLHKARPNTRVEKNPAENEKRFWLRWVQGDLRRADDELLERAGIEPPYSFILKFLPPEVEAELARLERLKADGDVNRVKKTRFGVRQDGDKCELYVIEQLYKR